MAKTEEKVPSSYSYDNTNAPDDLVINNTTRTIIISAEAHDIGKGPQRVEPGDRRRGEFFALLAESKDNPGLQLVRNMTPKQLEEFEKIRQIRTGERPDDWQVEAKERAARGHNPQDIDNVQRARANLEVAMRHC